MTQVCELKTDPRWWRREAKRLGISMWHKTKEQVIDEIENWTPPPPKPIEEAEPVEVIPEKEITWDDTLNAIPDGVQTLSKMPNRHIEPLYPKYIDRAKGAYVWAGDRKYIDYPCGLGTILLGYANNAVNEAVSRQIRGGTLFSLPHKLETRLAEKIIEHIPCAEKVRFLKTGTEATSAAVKIARAATGKEGIVCMGYHGWPAWYSATTDKRKGCPRVYSNLAGQCAYGDQNIVYDFFSLSNTVEKPIAAVIVEPYIYDAQPEFLKWVIEFAHNNEALVIFDEIVTGFRTKGFSAQKMFDITPDLCCLGKAMGNGVPISAVCGKAKYMAEIQGDCFVSSTFGGDLIGISAALATIEVLEKEPVIEHIWDMGQKLIDGFNEITHDILDFRLIGLPCRTFFDIPSDLHKTLLWQECIKRGILFGHAQFINYSHGEKEIDRTLEVLGEACDVLRKNWDEPQLAFDEGVKPISAAIRS